MKKVTFYEWAKDWVLATFVPIVSKAYLIHFFVSRAFDGSPLPQALVDGVMKKFADINSPEYAGVLVGLAAITVAAIVAPELAKGRPGFLHTLAGMRPKLGKATGWALDLLLFPLAFALSFGWQHDPAMLDIAVRFSIVYLVLSGVFSWVRTDGQHPYATFSYTLSTSDAKHARELRGMAADRLADHAAYCPGAGEVEVVAETADNAISLVIPLTFDAQFLSVDGQKKWALFLFCAEIEWREAGFAIERHASPALEPVCALLRDMPHA